MAEYDDLSTPKIAAVGFIGAMAVFALIVLLQAVFYWTEAQQRIEKDINQPTLEFANLTADQDAQLKSYRWVDQEQKIVRIPIKLAMELELARLSQEQQSAEKEGDNSNPTKKEQTHAQ